MKEYKPGKEYKQNAFLFVILIWIMASFLVYGPVYYFIKYGEIFEDSIGFNIFLIVYWFILFGILLYEIYRMYGIKASIDSKQIIYTNRKFTKTIFFNDVQKMKFTFYYNRSSIKLYTNTQKVRIYLVFKNAYEFIADMKKGLDASGKSAVYSPKILFKFFRMIFNAEIMQKWVYKLLFIMIMGWLLLFAIISITTVSEAKIIIAISGYISIMIISFMPVFIIQNRYKKETDEESFYFPPRDIEYEKTVVRKGFIILGILFVIVIILISIV